ncbi:Acetyltransferase (GNAT) domain-containing protein [Verrucomicrobium sp. GAS474]|uniref:GNAT family N-acetyltransferase n=1 Tax=Verrucomicrobium sp. GAS474 TaxID=1882831 RepID=UPI00087A6C44|nr:GNAT family N-acetyltransferase [Verrucomicrobium sp. GAS474]SDT87974.1 Acetyltransferase (GNAT) domain-containing protein [Verrucomicrobium sp. GAS474]
MSAVLPSLLYAQSGVAFTPGSCPSVASFRTRHGLVRLVNEARSLPADLWEKSFAHLCLDHRYYPLLEETLPQNFTYRYLVIEDAGGRPRSVQPIFVVHQDLAAGLPPAIRRCFDAVRYLFPRFAKLNTLMIGCSAGEGELGADAESERRWIAEALHEALPSVAARLDTDIIVLKDFPSRHRSALSVFTAGGYQRVASLPAVHLSLDFPDFEEYMKTRLSKKTRKNLRQKFRKTEEEPLEMEVVSDIGDRVDEIYPLYEAVHGRSRFQFEKLTVSYFREIGKRMGDRTRFFLWKRKGKIVAFSLCFVHRAGESDGEIYDCCMGLDYSVALDLHLYFVTWRDVVSWALTQKITRYYSGPLNYEPKYHFRCELSPLDLYVTHTNKWINPFFRKLLSYLEPVRHQPIVRTFPNAHEL